MEYSEVWSSIIIHLYFVIFSLLNIYVSYRKLKNNGLNNNGIWRILSAFILYAFCSYFLVVPSYSNLQGIYIGYPHYWNTLLTLLPITIYIFFPTIIVAVLFPIFRNELSDAKIFDISEGKFNTYLKNIFHSDHFFSTLNVSLPKGEKDSQFGLDYIPFMLDSIEKRRRRFEKSANNFYIMTLSLGILFSSVIIYFGYVFLNERSSGLPKILDDIEIRIDSLESNVKRSDINFFSYTSSDNFNKAYMDIKKYDTDSSLAQYVNQISKLVQKTVFTKDINKLYFSLDSLHNSIANSNMDNIDFTKSILKLRDVLTEIIKPKEEELKELLIELNKLSSLIAEVNILVQQPENRTAELIKRLAIGLIVSTFLLALLRFVAKLYQRRHNEMLVAESDDFLVRRFYTSYKCSIDNPEATKTVLQTFMKTSRNPNYNDLDIDSGNTKSQFTINDIINMFKKDIK